MRTGRPKQPWIITEEERERLESLAHRARSQALLARRARRRNGKSGRSPEVALLGQVEPGTHDYKRNGTTSLFTALELKTNQVIGQTASPSSLAGIPQVP